MSRFAARFRSHEWKEVVTLQLTRVAMPTLPQRVLVVAGSSARLAQGMKDVPVDAAIVGVIDTVDVQT